MRTLLTTATLLLTLALQSQTYLHGEMGWPSMMGFELEHFVKEDLSLHVNAGIMHVGLGIRQTLPTTANWYVDASTGLAGMVDVGGGSVTSLALGKRLYFGQFMVSGQLGGGWHDWQLVPLRGSGEPSTQEQWLNFTGQLKLAFKL